MPAEQRHSNRAGVHLRSELAIRYSVALGVRADYGSGNHHHGVSGRQRYHGSRGLRGLYREHSPRYHDCHRGAARCGEPDEHHWIPSVPDSADARGGYGWRAFKRPERALHGHLSRKPVAVASGLVRRMHGDGGPRKGGAAPMRHRRGNAMIETALFLPLFILLLVGMAEIAKVT